MRLFFTILTSFLACYGLAQNLFEEPEKQNGISIHIGQIQCKEENLHPKVFSGFTMGASYLRTKKKETISEYSAGMELSFLHTSYEEFPSALGILIIGDYRYLLPVTTRQKLTSYVGPVSHFHYGTHAYFNWDESHLYFANAISLGIGQKLFYKMEKILLVSNLEVPLVSGIARPIPNREYKIDDMTFSGILRNLSSNPELALPDKYFCVKTCIEFKYTTDKMKSRSIGYDFRYNFMQADHGSPFQQAMHTIFLTFNY